MFLFLAPLTARRLPVRMGDERWPMDGDAISLSRLPARVHFWLAWV